MTFLLFPTPPPKRGLALLKRTHQTFHLQRLFGRTALIDAPPFPSGDHLNPSRSRQTDGSSLADQLTRTILQGGLSVSPNVRVEPYAPLGVPAVRYLPPALDFAVWIGDVCFFPYARPAPLLSRRQNNPALWMLLPVEPGGRILTFPIAHGASGFRIITLPLTATRGVTASVSRRAMMSIPRYFLRETQLPLLSISSATLLIDIDQHLFRSPPISPYRWSRFTRLRAHRETPSRLSLFLLAVGRRRPPSDTPRNTSPFPSSCRDPWSTLLTESPAFPTCLSR